MDEYDRPRTSATTRFYRRCTQGSVVEPCWFEILFQNIWFGNTSVLWCYHATISGKVAHFLIYHHCCSIISVMSRRVVCGSCSAQVFHCLSRGGVASNNPHVRTHSRRDGVGFNQPPRERVLHVRSPRTWPFEPFLCLSAPVHAGLRPPNNLADTTPGHLLPPSR